MKHSGQPKLLAPNKVLSQLEELELSQAQHEMEVARDRKYDRKHCLIQYHIKYPELQGCCEEHMPNPKSPLPFLIETHLLIHPIYFFPVLNFIKKRYLNQLSHPLKDLLSLILVKRNKVYSFKTEKGNLLQPNSIQSPLVFKLQSQSFPFEAGNSAEINWNLH